MNSGISRRTVLKGLGHGRRAARGWRRWCPGRGPADGRRRGERPAPPDGVPLRPQRHEHGRLDARRARRQARRAARDPRAARRRSRTTCVLTGLTLDKARANGDGRGDHARAMAAFLTGRQPRKTARRRHPRRHLGRPARRDRDRRPDAVPVARARHRAGRAGRQLRLGL